MKLKADMAMSDKNMQDVKYNILTHMILNEHNLLTSKVYNSRSSLIYM